MAGDQLSGTSGSKFRSRVVSGTGDSVASGVRTEETAQFGKSATGLCWQCFFAVFRRVAIPSPYQNAVLMIWISEQCGKSVCGNHCFPLG